MKYNASSKELALYPVVDGVMFKEGRELCLTHTGYANRIIEMADRQVWMCAICEKLMRHPTFEHEAGKGAGGSRQDDALSHPDGRWKNAAVHGECNTEKGSRRFEWRGNEYQPVSAWIEVEIN